MRRTAYRPVSWLCAAVIGTVLAPAGCTTGQRGAPAAPRPTAAPPAQPRAESVQHYVVDSSHFRVRVYRDGPLAHLGHNHVVTSTGLEGEIELAEPRGASRFTLRLAVESLQVDLPAERAAAGTDFSAAVPETDRAGTRHNMLAGALLDAEHFPVLTIESLNLSGGPEEWMARVVLTLRGGQHELEVPLRISTLPDGPLQVEGDFIADHAALGLVPFSVAMGALRVRPDLAIDFRLRALPADRRPGGT